ncbi:PAS domain S-box protein [Bacillus massiliglaciei]|uniref:PAS domain S-box protein n=1 Tax=Bacillus massiliglaciei TaxID=1816693 RepID=UPI000ADF09C4|nr:PAS domain S-box protein [Bacillus massiliglaciei]
MKIIAGNEMKVQNKQLEESKLIFDALYDPYIIVDETETITHVNKAACRLLQLSADKLLNTKLDEFFNIVVIKENWGPMHTQEKIFQMEDGEIKHIEFLIVDVELEGKTLYRLRDRTEEKARDREQALSSKMFLDLYNTAIDSIILFDRSGIIYEVNEAFTKLAKISKSQIVGKNIKNLVAPEYREFWEESMDTVTQNGVDSGEIEMRIGLQHLHFTFSTSLPIYQGFFMSIFEDVTDSKLIKKRLDSSERIFTELFEQTVDAIIFWDHNGIIFRVNESACRIFESERDQLLGSHIWQHVHQKNHHFIKVVEAIQTEGQTRAELFYKMPNGQIKLLELTAKKHVGEGYYITIFRNVSERWQIEQDLRESEKKFRKIFEGSLDGKIIWSEQGFVDINEVAIEILEIPKHVFLGLSLEKFISILPNTKKVLKDHIEIALKKQEYTSLIPITFKNGRKKHLEFSTRANLYSGLHLTIVRDVSEKLALQEQIRKSDTLNVVGELAAGIAHEIRNPMTALKGFIQLLQGSVKEDYSNYFTIITSEIERIESIITEFLVLAKPQAMKYFEQDVNTILRETLGFLKAEALLKDIEFSIDFKEPEFKIFCESNQLKQVFINIIKNAFEVMSDGGTVYIKTRKNEKNMVCISIRDEGYGLSEEKIKRLGEPFYTTKERGTGLGLMVSYKIIEEHNGFIEVESEEGKGTVFHLYLPVNMKCAE